MNSQANATVYDKAAHAFKRGVPIVTLTTADPALTVKLLREAIDAPLVQFDVADGWKVPEQPNQEEAKKRLAVVDCDAQPDPAEALIQCRQMDDDTVVVLHNAHVFVNSDVERQAIWNCRDEFKATNKMLVLLGPQFQVPAELQNDVVQLDEPLPDHSELVDVIAGLCAEVDVDVDSEAVQRAASASAGLSGFAAEQYAAINLSREGLDVPGIWEDKCAKINETPGLQVVSGDKTFEDVAGVSQAKKFVRKILGGCDAPNTIVFIDEIEKSISGQGDTSGVSQDQLGVLLQWMQDNAATGMILVGPPGAAKSAFAKTAGGEGGIPTIQLDLGGMKGEFVGTSETRIRDALKVVHSVSGGKTMWIATCNSLASLPPELKRRFNFGTWFFDLPTREERKAIWDLYVAKFGVSDPSDKLLDQPWTGAEIESCCRIAWQTNDTVDECAEFIVPVATAAADSIAKLQESAVGKFLNAAAPGPYAKPKPQKAKRTRKASI